MSIAASSSPVPVRRRRDESPERTLGRFHESGLTQRAFCEQAGLSVSTLQW
jgi:lambda repressor-like predicted transcriptional regulator